MAASVKNKNKKRNAGYILGPIEKKKGVLKELVWVLNGLFVGKPS